MDKSLKALQRRLEKMELEHLRQHALELHERLEKAEEDLRRSEELVEFWWRNAIDLQAELIDDGHTVGLTQTGQLLVLHNDQSAPPAVSLPVEFI